MQMATLEQLNNMMQQMHKQSASTLNSDPKDILSLPIVQKVIMAYEDELKLNKSSKDCHCKCDEVIPTILEHLNNHNSKLQLIENRLNDLFTLLERKETSEPVIDKTQTKLTSFPGFGQVSLSEHIMMNLSLQEKYLKSLETSDTHDLELHSLKEEARCLDEEVHNLNEEFRRLKESLQQSYLEEDIYSSEQPCLESQQPCLDQENITLNIEEIETDIEEDETDDVEEETDEEETDEEETDEPIVVDAVVTEAVEEETEDAVEEDDVVADAVEEETEDAVVADAVEEETEDAIVADAVVADAVEEDVSDETESTEEEVVTEEDEKVDDVDEEPDEEGEEVFEIEIDDVTYFATDEENGILYEVDKDGDIGKKVGIIKDGEPIFS